MGFLGLGAADLVVLEHEQVHVLSPKWPQTHTYKLFCCPAASIENMHFAQNEDWNIFINFRKGIFPAFGFIFYSAWDKFPPKSHKLQISVAPFC